MEKFKRFAKMFAEMTGYTALIVSIGFAAVAAGTWAVTYLGYAAGFVLIILAAIALVSFAVVNEVES